jgi:hypothetical protein
VVGDGDHLEVAAAQSEDAVVRADPDVAPAAALRQRVLVGEAVGRRVQVVGDPDDVVDAQLSAVVGDALGRELERDPDLAGM